MDEWLDIVDANDKVIGSATRSDVHRRELMHRAVHVLLFDSAGSLFLQLRSANKDTNPGMWDSSAAGHVNTGESYIDCAVRELGEELDVHLTPDDFTEIGRLPPSIHNGFEFVRVYRTTSDAQVTLEADEIDDGKWLAKTELSALLRQEPELFASGFDAVWACLQSTSS